MRHFLRLTSLALFFSATGIAAPSAVEEYGNINRGALSVGGEFSINVLKSDKSTSSEVTISTPVQYFILDKVGVGFSFEYYRLDSLASLTIEPSVTWYFWTFSRLAMFVGVRWALYIIDEPKYNSALKGSWGINYFLTPKIAVGPTFTLTRFNDVDNSFNYRISGGITYYP